ERATGHAPFRPEIHQNGGGIVFDGIRERTVIEMKNVAHVTFLRNTCILDTVQLTHDIAHGPSFKGNLGGLGWGGRGLRRLDQCRNVKTICRTKNAATPMYSSPKLPARLGRFIRQLLKKCWV